MRIIAGEYRGRVLTTLADLRVRPVTDRVKGSIFNMLQNRLDLRDAYILDLFAGSGSLGFEALSRGARHVVFVEQDHEIVETITANAETLGCEEQCTIIHGDAQDYISRAEDKHRLIFADPPYVFEQITELPSNIFRRRLLQRDGFLIIEHSQRTTFPASEHYRCAVHKRYGNTHISFFVHPKELP